MNILRFLYKAVILLNVTLLCSVVYAELINIDIKERVTLPEKQIILGDVAVVTCHNNALTQQICNIKMGQTPWPGNTLRVGKDIFSMRLAAEGIELPNVTFSGAEAATVSVLSITLTGQEIAEKAKEYLVSRLPWDNEDVLIELERLPADMTVPKGQSDVRLEISDTDSNKDRGAIQLLVSVIVDDKVFSKFRVFFRVHIFENVAVTRKQLGRMETLKEDDIFLKRTETTNLAGITFYKVEDLIGKRTLRPIRPYSVVTFDMVETPPAIRKGDVIKLLIKKESFMVVTKGISKEDGKKGEVIRVKNFESHKELYGKIIDSETVAIAF
ncbi:MAG TPA: flagellar basal body P-ring formation chaperone FlgA [Candidatus Brocadiales bacterium]|nr:flagellar basal body P-ring formation chaperone FlgA [Candidatus Brocadiales bacterium]